MANRTLKERVADLLAAGRTISEIAYLVNRTKNEVHQIRWKLKREHNQRHGITAADLASQGLGYLDIREELGISEREAREAVFGHANPQRKVS